MGRFRLAAGRGALSGTWTPHGVGFAPHGVCRRFAAAWSSESPLGIPIIGDALHRRCCLTAGAPAGGPRRVEGELLFEQLGRPWKGRLPRLKSKI